MCGVHATSDKCLALNLLAINIQAVTIMWDCTKIANDKPHSSGTMLQFPLPKMGYGLQMHWLQLSALEDGSCQWKNELRTFIVCFKPSNSNFIMVPHMKNAGDGNVLRQRAASWNTSDSSVADDSE